MAADVAEAPEVADRSVRDLAAGGLHDLSRAERQVARALLADYPSAALGTVASLAERAGVSPPTVVRFAQSLGLAGFPALQAALRDELTRRSTGPLARLDRPGPPGAAGDRPPGSLHDTLVARGRDRADLAVRSLAAIPAASLEAAVAMLADPSRRVVVSGGRFSRVVAEHLALHLEQVRPGVQLLSDPFGADLGTTVDLSRRSLLVLFDYHRYQRSAEELAATARRAGSGVLLVTDDLACPVAPHAEVVLAASSASGTAFQSMTAGFLLVELLLLAVLEALGEPARTRLALWDQRRAREVLA